MRIQKSFQLLTAYDPDIDLSRFSNRIAGFCFLRRLKKKNGPVTAYDRFRPLKHNGVKNRPKDRLPDCRALKKMKIGGANLAP